MTAFFLMGGFAWYVWPAYGITAVILLSSWFFARRKHRKLLQRDGYAPQT